MPFYRFDMEDGTTMTAHVNLGGKRNRTAVPCVFPDFASPKERCYRMTAALCDHPAGQALDGTALTCDAPMCERHRTKVGPNVDHCPRHAKLLALPAVDR